MAALLACVAGEVSVAGVYRFLHPLTVVFAGATALVQAASTCLHARPGMTARVIAPVVSDAGYVSRKR